MSAVLDETQEMDTTLPPLHQHSQLWVFLFNKFTNTYGMTRTAFSLPLLSLSSPL